MKYCVYYKIHLSNFLLFFRKRYLVHGLNLKLYQELGLRVVKIHRGIRFTQEKFIKPFIEECTIRRAAAPTATEQTMWKLICNSVYGKFIESYDKRMTCRFNKTREAAIRNSTSPLFKGTLICGEDLTISFHKKKELVLTQSWAIGFSILEISKYVMQTLYYKHLQPAVGFHNLQMIMSDTDSFLVLVKNHSEDRVMSLIQDVMDFSNLPPTHALFSAERSKQPGLLKNEIPHAKITEVVALKSKTYSIRTNATNVQVNKAKGVVKNVKKKIPFNAYKACIDEIQNHNILQHSLRSKQHVNQLLESKKVAFSSYDDKRYLLCAKHSVPYGSTIIDISIVKRRCFYCDLEI